jgi:lysophospholipase L1-like esterase
MLGSNDLLQQPAANAGVCAERMEKVLTALLQEIPALCEIVLIAPPPMELGTWVNDPKTLEESRWLAGC